ncbi:MAG: ATPase, T2SS/T4P/T4SS family [Candidatus Omnitrophota bacterium]
MMDKKKKLLGEMLIEAGLIDAEQLQKALKEQRKIGRRLGQTLVELGYISQEDLIIVLGRQLNIPHIDLKNYSIKPELAKLISENMCRRHEMIPLDKVGNTLTIGMADPLNIFAIDEVQRLTHCRIEQIVCSPQAIIEAIDYCYDKKPAPAKRKKTPAEDEDKSPVETIEQGKEAIAIVNEIIELAIKERATDIHIEPDEEMVRVRLRIDGLLHQVRTFSQDSLGTIVSRIKILSALDISEKRLPQDGRFGVKVEEREIDLRVSTLPTVLGEKVVMRLLDKAQLFVKLEQLGFLPKNLELFEKLIHRPYGMILVTGPTSSGKTTTLYSALQTINTVEKNILTVEDPVEYRLRYINQVQVNPRAGLTFAAGLRAFLRQDPNVIMIGEVRDLETAEIAVQAALTGHLVFSTIHTNDAPSTISRLIDMKVEPFLVSSAVVGVLAQRLIRRICHECKEAYKPDKELIKELDLAPGDYTFYQGKGCEKCKQTGYYGREGIFELMMINDEIKQLILEGAPAINIKHAAQKTGLKTLREDGVAKIVSGITTAAEVFRVTAEEARSV